MNGSLPSSSNSTISNSFANAETKEAEGLIDDIVERCTPVLFSTNRGLFLRKPDNRKHLHLHNSGSGYVVKFCDLEKWTNVQQRLEFTNLSKDRISTNTGSSFVPSTVDRTQRKSQTSAIRYVQPPIKEFPYEGG